MSNEISSASSMRPPTPPIVAMPRADALANKTSAPDHPNVQAPKKAEIRFDAEQMRKSLQDSIERLNEQMRQSGQNLNFSIDKSIDRVIVTVKNTHSGEVIRQIPDEALVRVAHNIEDLRGLLLNKKI